MQAHTPVPPVNKSLQLGALRWTRVAGLGIAIAVSGQFSGWNYGLTAGGWGGLVAAALVTGLFYLGFTQCVAELAAAMPSAGGFETYCQRAFGIVSGYLVGMSVLVALAIAIGVVANFTAAYGKSLVGIGAWPIKAVLFSAVLALQLRGAREAVGVTMWVGAVAIGVLLLFCISMAPFAKAGHLLSQGGGRLFTHGALGIFASLPYALWLFLGVAQAGGGVEQIRSADDPLYAALTSPFAFGHENWLTRTISGGALIGLMATFFSVVYTSSRQLYSLSRDGYLPKWLSATNRKQAPHAALLVVIAIGIVASVFAPEKAMLLVIFLLSFSYLVVLAVFVRLRARGRDIPRPYRAVGGVFTAYATTALLLLVLGACLVQEFEGMLYAVVVYALLLGYFLLFQRSQQRQQRT